MPLKITDAQAFELLEKYNDVEEKPQEYYDALTIVSSKNKINEEIQNDANHEFYENIWDMIKDIKNNGTIVSQNDDVLTQSIGYICLKTGKSWSIKLINLYKSLELEQNDQKRNTFKQCFKSQYGKMILLDFLNNKS